MIISHLIFTQKNTKATMEHKDLHSTIGDKNIVVTLNIYGARAIFLLFCDHQDTEYELCEI